MARPTKTGLDYFALDVDMFQDIKIRKLIRRKGGQAATVYTVLLCFIYKNGYFIEADDDLAFIVSEQLGFDEKYISEVIDYCVDLGLFDKKLRDESQVLTSVAIQTRYVTAAKKSRRNSAISAHSLIAAEPTAAQKSAEKKEVAPKPVEPQPVAQPKSIKLDAAIEQMWNDREWVDASCSINEIGVDELSKKLHTFTVHCRAEGKSDLPYRDLNDAKAHFNAWLRKSKVAAPVDIYAKRRGHLLTADSKKEKNWDSTF